MPRLEKAIAAAGKAVADAENQKQMQVLYTAFNTATKAKDTAAIFTSGKAILAKQPEFLDVIITLANAGFDDVGKNASSAYTADTVAYANSAIQKIEAGKVSESKDYGALDYVLGDKNNALRYLNYVVGFTMSVRQDKKKDALPYFYKSAKLETAGKAIPIVYQAIGAYYLDEALRINGVRTEAIKEAGGKDTDETLAMEAEQRGYADRAIDAYARAYKLAKADKASTKESVDNLYGKLTDLYKFRYDNKTEGIDTFVASVQSKPLPDPSTPIVPVKVDVPNPDGTTPATTPTPTVTVPATTTPAATKPTTPATKPATTTAPATKPATTTPKTAPTTPVGANGSAAKPAPKKKGTR